MISKRFAFALSAAGVALATIASPSIAASEEKYVAGWVIEGGSFSCSMRKEDYGRGILGVDYGIDREGDLVTEIKSIYLRINGKNLPNGKAVDLVHMIGGRPFILRAEPVANAAFVGEFRSAVNADYAALLSTAPDVAVSDPNGKPLFKLSLAGVPKALAALKDCTRNIDEGW